MSASERTAGRVGDEMLAASFSAPSLIDNPFPAYRQLLEHGPWRAPSGPLVVGGYDDLLSILRDHDGFVMQPGAWPNFHRSNPPDHTRVRRLVSRAFTPRAVRELAPRLREVANDLLDRHADAGGMDLMSDYANQIPGIAIAEMLGVPWADAEIWWSWLETMAEYNYREPFSVPDYQALQPAIDGAQSAMAAAADYFSAVVAERRGTSGSDLVTTLANAREENEQLTEEELLYCLVVLLHGGLHTTVLQIGNTIAALLETDGAPERVVADPNLLPNVIEEGLRFDGTLQTEHRVAAAPRAIGGVEIHPGDEVITVHAAANRDPAVFERPDEFDVGRSNADRHQGFGFGMHVCIGAPLARLEMQVAIGCLLDRFPDVRVSGEPVRSQSYRLRGYEALPISWN